MKTNKDRFKVEIFFDGKETTAYLLKNDVPVKDTVAKCHPDDKFSMAVGSQLALARLFEKKQKEEFSNETIDNFVNLLLLLGDRIIENEKKEKSQVKEVKRNAKVGEWVKVVGNNSRHQFKIGEIVKCLESKYTDRFQDSHMETWCMNQCDYVVLEGYNHVQ